MRAACGASANLRRIQREGIAETAIAREECQLLRRIERNIRTCVMRRNFRPLCAELKVRVQDGAAGGDGGKLTRRGEEVERPTNIVAQR
jgi:hypothetical protein